MRTTNIQLLSIVKPAVESRLGSLMERSLKIGQVIVLAVVMRDRAGRVMVAVLPDVGQPALDQRQHILQRHPGRTATTRLHCDVDRRGVGEHAALPFIVVMQRSPYPAARSAPPARCGCHLERGFQVSRRAPLRVFCAWRRRAPAARSPGCGKGRSIRPWPPPPPCRRRAAVAACRRCCAPSTVK